MATQPDLLRLTLVPGTPDGVLEVRPIVNGRDLLADASPRDTGESPQYAGLGPRYLLGLDGRLHATATPHRVRLALSGCGVEVCCGALYATVRRDAGQVVWAGWSDSGWSDPDLPELRFAADQYEAEVWGGSHDAAERLGYPWPPVVPWDK